MALGSQLENSHIALLVRPAENITIREHLFKRPPNSKISLKRLLKKAKLALLPAKERPLNQDINRNEKTPIISHLIKKTYQERP